jgi:hypothetical protein
MKNFAITQQFKGYRTKTDESKLGDGYLISGSQNVLSTDGENIKIREGYTIFGVANAALTPIESAFDWQTNTGESRHLRSYDDELEVYDELTSAWVRVKSGWTDVNFNYAYWWDTNENKDILLFVNGDSNIYAWGGGIAKIGTTTANTIQLLDTSSTWAEKRFLLNPGGSAMTYDKKIMINGTEYTYTGGETTNTLTGVTPNPSAEASGSLAVQSVTTFANKPGSDATLFSNDLIRVLKNQVWIGSTINNEIFVSKNTDFTDFTYSSPRVPGEGMLLTLDGSPTGFIEQEENMYISAGNDQWYISNFALSSDNLNELLSVIRLKTTAQEAAYSQGAITKMKNNIVYISKEPTLDILGRLENFDTPQSRPISDSIKPDFNSLDLTNVDIKYHRNNLYISFPNESLVYVYNIEKGFWEAPLLLPISKFAIIDGELYGHSSAVPETYRLFNGTNDNGKAIDAVVKFSYQNFGDRVNLKQFNEFYSEGKISSNTILTLTINYELDGSLTAIEKEIDGSDSSILFQTKADNSLGKNKLGSEPIGSNTEAPNSLSKFRQIDTMIKTDFHEIQVVYESNQIDGQWEILAFGAPVTKSSAEPISIKK